MNKVQVLDCTLRDGGYCNNWQFGFENAKKITSGLVEANVDIIECGFISHRIEYNPDSTIFPNIKKVSTVIPEKREGKLFVSMLNYGEYDVNKLTNYDGTSVDGLRVAFHKKNYVEALDVCKKIKEKGYLVFIQAMVSLSYSDYEFLNLIKLVNNINPYAFYIVDSFGMMKRKDLTRLFYMVEHNLNENIRIGFHSHNNLQLAFSNAQELTTIQTNRSLIIDSSIMGMGRGAGNLNTELFVDYLNENAGMCYFIKPLLAIIDNILTPFYERNYWGYSLPNYISATHNAHPNYAGYLDTKKTLTFEDMNYIFDMMDEEKKVSFSKEYIEKLYIKYQEKDTTLDEHLAEFKERIKDKTALIIAPGKSSETEKDKIIAFATKEDVVSFSINFDFKAIQTDYIFVSNLRRFRDIQVEKRAKSIITSNIPAVDVYLQFRYKELLNSVDFVQDNASLMLIKLLINQGMKSVYIAGMDGYSTNPYDNYADVRMDLNTKRETAEKKNKGMISVLKDYGKRINIKMLTTPKYVLLSDDN